MDDRKQARDIAWRCVRDAKSTLEAGWAHVSDDVRWGLVAANVLAVVVGQHWIDDPDATVEQRAAVADYTLALWQEAMKLRERGWKK